MCEGAFAGPALADKAENFSASRCSRAIAQHRRLARIAHSYAGGEQCVRDYPVYGVRCVIGIFIDWRSPVSRQRQTSRRSRTFAERGFRGSLQRPRSKPQKVRSD